jgi:hypothetical protein
MCADIRNGRAHDARAHDASKSGENRAKAQKIHHHRRFCIVFNYWPVPDKKSKKALFA